jgi:hypothetical protein
MEAYMESSGRALLVASSLAVLLGGGPAPERPESLALAQSPTAA